MTCFQKIGTVSGDYIHVTIILITCVRGVPIIVVRLLIGHSVAGDRDVMLTHLPCIC